MQSRYLSIVVVFSILVFALSGCVNVDKASTSGASNTSSPEIISQVDKYISTELPACISYKSNASPDKGDGEILLDCIKPNMTNSTYAFRKEMFSRPIAWQMAAYSKVEKWALGIILLIVLFSMWLGYNFNLILINNINGENLSRQEAYFQIIPNNRLIRVLSRMIHFLPSILLRHLCRSFGVERILRQGVDETIIKKSDIQKITDKYYRMKYLFIRDVGPIAYDVGMHQEKAEPAEYRGVIHWFRDVAEKVLSVTLTVFFVAFVVRMGRYVYCWFTGAGWFFSFIPLDLNAALTIVGVALIVDSFILVSSMTDAPGISRTLDAVIVALAGFLIMLVEAQPGDYVFVTFSLGKQDWLCVGMTSAIGFLFLVRWVVRNKTWKELCGKDSCENNQIASSQNAGNHNAPSGPTLGALSSGESMPGPIPGQLP